MKRQGSNFGKMLHVKVGLIGESEGRGGKKLLIYSIPDTHLSHFYVRPLGREGVGNREMTCSEQVPTKINFNLAANESEFKPFKLDKFTLTSIEFIKYLYLWSSKMMSRENL